MLGTAKEIMTTEVVSIGLNDNLEKAVKLLADNNISGLPVVDDSNRVIGIISESDIVKFSSKLQIVSFFGSSGWISPYTDVSTLASFSKGYDLLPKTKVKEIMTEKVITVQETTAGEEIARILSKKDINRLPVTDKNGGLVGIITRSNLINHMAKQK